MENKNFQDSSNNESENGNNLNPGQTFSPDLNNAPNQQPKSQETTKQSEVNLRQSTESSPEQQTNQNIAPSNQQEVNPAQLPQQFNNQPNKNSKKKILIILSILLGFVIVGVGGYIAYSNLLNKQSNPAEQQDQPSKSEISIPEDWQDLDTEQGFIVKAPMGWESEIGSSGSFNQQKSECSTLNDKDAFNFTVTGDSAEATAEQPKQPIIINACKETIAGVDSKEGFEQEITDLGKYKQAYEAFGIDTDQIELSKSTMQLGNKEWLRLYTSIPNQISLTYYYWNVDHMIALKVVEQSNDNTKLDMLDTEYLSPMASSASIQ